MMLHLIIIYYLVVNPFQGTQLLGMDMQLFKEGGASIFLFGLLYLAAVLL